MTPSLYILPLFQTDRRTNIMAIALRFVLTNAMRAKNGPENVLPLNAVRRDAVANFKTVWGVGTPAT